MIEVKKVTPPGKTCGYIKKIAAVEAIVLTLWSLLKYLTNLEGTMNGMRINDIMYLSGEFLWRFSDILRNALDGFYICAAANIGFVIDNYVYFYTGSKSVYTMKRLRRAGEMHLRCWTVPLFWAAALLLCSQILRAVYFLFYWLAVPYHLDSWRLMF